MYIFGHPLFTLVCFAVLLIVALLAVCGVFALRERRLKSQRRNMRHIRILRQVANRRRPRD